jgi:hypothetical protein
MNQCLRCSGPCIGTSVFCDACQSSLLNRSQQKEISTPTLPALPVEEPTLPLLPARWSSVPCGSVPRRIRIALITVAVVLLLAVIIDAGFVAALFSHQDHKVADADAFPLLTLTPGIGYPGQHMQLHLSNFPSSSRVLLTHDIDEALSLNGASSLIQIGPTGEADIQAQIASSWKPGEHFIEAEDVNTRYTASAPFQIVGAGSAWPPQLQTSQTMLNMGADAQGANTFQSVMLHNAGSGFISWTASSNQSWLMFTPSQGIFSDSQCLSVAVTRVHLRPGSYSGTITITSSMGLPVTISVKMSVLPSTIETAAVPVVTPPVFSFTATDGGSNPTEQTLTISNPGARPLHWSMTSDASTSPPGQSISTSPSPLATNTNWVNVEPASGTLAPGGTASLQVVVHSSALLPGYYSSVFLLTSDQKQLATPQVIAVSLTVQQHCGVAATIGEMSFTLAPHQHAPDSQALELSTTPGCSAPTLWQAFSTANWLTVTPAHGQVQVQTHTTTTLAANGGSLAPGTYSGIIVFLTAQHTQTLVAQLTVLASSSTQPQVQPIALASPTSNGGNSPSSSPSANSTPSSNLPSNGSSPASTDTPAPNPPILGAAPSELLFSTTQGQANPSGQVVTIANAGGTALSWQASIEASPSFWLNISPAAGTISAGQTAQMIVNVDASGLAPGSYRAQISVTASSASSQVQNSPLLLSVALTVSPPCTLQVSSTSLTFSSTLLNPTPPGQSITLRYTGNCAFPVSWRLSANGSNTSWITPSATRGTGNSLTISVNSNGMLIGTYQAQLTLSATDSSGVAAQNSPQGITITLHVTAA